MCIICETLGTQDGLSHSGLIETAIDTEKSHRKLLEYLLINHRISDIMGGREDDFSSDMALVAMALAVGRLIGQQEAGLDPFSDFLDELDHD